MDSQVSPRQLALQFCQQAKIFINQKQWKMAVSLCYQALKQDYSCALADKLLGVIYQAQGQLTIAEHWYQSASLKQPDFAEVYANLGSLYAQQQNWDASVKAYQNAIQFKPNFAGVYQNIAKVWTQLNQPEAALNALNQALKLQQNLITEIDYIEIGDVLTQQQQLQAALSCYRQAIQLNPSFFKSYHKQATVLVQLQRWEEAITAYKNAIELNPDFCWSYNGLAQALVQLNKWQEAVTVYQTTIRLNPDFCWSYYHLGKVYSHLEQWENASQCFEQAIALNSDSAQFYQELGLIYMKMQAWEKAVITLQKIIEFDCASPRIYIHLAEALIKLERWQDAVETYHQIINLDWQSKLNFSHFIQFGKACSQVKAFTDAITCYQQAIAQQPRQSWLYTLLAEAFQNNQQSEAAIEAYHQAINLGLNSSWVLTNLGDLYTQNNQFIAATTAYQQAGYQKVVEDYPELTTNYTTLKQYNFPNFLIIGSSKCGTTSLYHNMIKHPQVLPALKKEIKFWHDDLKQGLDWYRAHFLPCPQTQQYLTGEASPNYLDLQETAQRVFQFYPKIKLIIILRNPVKRAISHYYHWVRLGLEHRSLEEIIQTELNRIDKVLEFPIQYRHWYQSINYIARGVYIGFIQQWMAIFPPDQFLILSCEHLGSNPKATMKQVFTFLGLPDSPTCHYTQLNVGDYPPISPSLSQTLSKFYHPYNQQLEEYLGMRFRWK